MLQGVSSVSWLQAAVLWYCFVHICINCMWICCQIDWWLASTRLWTSKNGHLQPVLPHCHLLPVWAKSENLTALPNRTPLMRQKSRNNLLYSAVTQINCEEDTNLCFYEITETFQPAVMGSKWHFNFSNFIHQGVCKLLQFSGLKTGVSGLATKCTRVRAWKLGLNNESKYYQNRNLAKWNI